MKSSLTLGILGGMSPESTVTYYQYIVRRHQEHFRDHSYPRMLVASVSFQQYMDWQHKGDWTSVANGLAQECESLARAGADFAVIASNTMHKLLPQIAGRIPILSVFDAVSVEANRRGWQTLGLTGTRFTMNEDFYRAALEKRGLRIILPGQEDRESINRIIYSELIEGRVSVGSVGAFRDIRKRLMDQHADAVLLGCTELQMLVPGDDHTTPVLDSTRVHAELAWQIATGQERMPDSSNHQLQTAT